MDRKFDVQVHHPVQVFKQFTSYEKAMVYARAIRRSFPDAHITLNHVDV